MVLLTIVAPSNPHANPSRDHETKLHTSPICSIYNSWYNLKKGIIPLSIGNYTIDSLAEELNNMKEN